MVMKFWLVGDLIFKSFIDLLFVIRNLLFSKFGGLDSLKDYSLFIWLVLHKISWEVISSYIGGNGLTFVLNSRLLWSVELK